MGSRNVRLVLSLYCVVYVEGQSPAGNAYVLTRAWRRLCGPLQPTRSTDARSGCMVLNNCRGYAGELTAASALDTVVNEGNALLVDIRTVKEKEASGIPDVPSGGSGKVRCDAT